MSTSDAEAGFYAALPTLDTFARLADPAVYAPVPGGWVLGLADIVRSTEAIEAGRYKEVNTAAAAVIAAVSNAIPGEDFPFVFGGDGASFALDPSREAVGREALARTSAWIATSFGLTLRVAMVPVDAIRRNGHDLRLARFAVSPTLSYAMFSGGGLAWAEARLKAGDFAIAPATDGKGPDLGGLSCRFSEIPARHGVILSLIVMPAEAGFAAFGEVAVALLQAAEAEGGGGGGGARPVPEGGPALAFTRRGFLSETRTAGAATGRWPLVSGIRVFLRSSLAYLIFRRGRRVRDFDPRRYLEELVRNSDFRKFDDGLRMTLDCPPETAARIEALLAAAAARGAVVYGLHRQAAALMTCFVPSPTRSDHVHFIDGASGGYAMAARALKTRAGVSAPAPAPA